MSKMERLLIASVAGLILSVGPALAQTKLVTDVYFPRQHPLFSAYLKPFAEEMAKATEGRVTIEFSAAALSPSNRQFDSVVKGVSDVAASFVGWQRNTLLLPQVGQLPFTTTSAERAAPALWRTHQKHFETANEYKNVKLLGYALQPGDTIYTRDKPLRRVEDFKGVKFRTAAGESAQIIETLGGTVVISSGPQIFEFMSKGIVDGLITTDDSLGSFKITEYVKYRLSIPKRFGTLVWSIMMNQKKWDGLSKAEQEAIMSIAGEKLARSGGRGYDQANEAELARSKAAGIQFLEADSKMQADIHRLLAFMREEWYRLAEKRNVDGAAALNYYLAQQELIN